MWLLVAPSVFVLKFIYKTQHRKLYTEQHESHNKKKWSESFKAGQVCCQDISNETKIKTVQDS